MAHKPTPKAMTEFMSSHTALLRLGSYDQLVEKLKNGGQGTDGLEIPSYTINALVDDKIGFTAYLEVDVLPIEGDEGIFYVYNGGLYIYHKDTAEWENIGSGTGPTPTVSSTTGYGILLTEGSSWNKEVLVDFTLREFDTTDIDTVCIWKNSTLTDSTDFLQKVKTGDTIYLYTQKENEIELVASAIYLEQGSSKIIKILVTHTNYEFSADDVDNIWDEEAKK